MISPVRDSLGGWHEAVGEVGGSPPRWFRIVSAAMAVLFALGLMNAHELTDILWSGLACSFMLLNAIAPRRLYDGTFNAWMGNHPIVNGSLIFLFLGGMLALLLSDYVAGWLAAVIAVPLAAAFAAWVAYRERTAARGT